jgi:hypothetical protein
LVGPSFPPTTTLAKHSQPPASADGVGLDIARLVQLYPGCLSLPELLSKGLADKVRHRTATDPEPDFVPVGLHIEFTNTTDIPGLAAKWLLCGDA